MKIRMVVLFAAAICITGCKSLFTTENYQPYVGSTIYKGEGGTMQVYDGMPFWNDGVPDQDFKIIGIINTSFVVNPLLHFDQTQDIVKIAREHGGDAVVLKGRHQELSYGDPQASPTEYRKWMVVKYVTSDSQTISK